MDTRTPAGASRPGIVVDDSACDLDDLSPCGGVEVTASGEEDWEGLVALAVASGWPGLEALAALSGDVANAVRANAAAHGQVVSDTVASVRTWDLSADAQRTFPWGDCDFGPGSSRFQERLPDGRDRYHILDVTFLFRHGDLTAPVRDEGLAARLGVPPGDRVPLTAVRDAVRHTSED